MTRLVSAVWLVLLALAIPAGLYRPPAEPLWVGGIQVNEPDHAAWIRALDEHGLNTVAVTVYAHQGDWDSANLWWEEEPWVVAEIRAARERGLAAVLVLRVALDHAFPRNKFFWHGMIQPLAERDLAEWFERYERFVRQWSHVAEREGVAVLAIGSELNHLTSTLPVDELPPLEAYWTDAEKVARERARLLSLDERREARAIAVRGHPDYASLAEFLQDRDAAHAGWARRVAFLDDPDPVAAVNRRRELLDRGWRQVTAAAREEYGGRLTYAANFDQYERVAFWDELDLIGVNAYFPLLKWHAADLGEAELAALLEARWRLVLRSVDRLRRERGVPAHRVLFTEIGYVARAHATVQPWAGDEVTVVPSRGGPRLVDWRRQPADLAERALALRSLYRAHLDLGGDLLAGLLYWKLTTVPSHREIEPFALLLGAEPPDPLVRELARFARDLPEDRLRSRRSAERWRAMAGSRFLGVAPRPADQSRRR